MIIRVKITAIRQRVLLSLVLAAGLLLTGCGTTSHLVVSKSDFASAEQCLIAQQSYQPILQAQQDNLRASLEVLRDSLELHHRGHIVRDLSSQEGMEGRDLDCPIVSFSQQLPSERQLDKQIVGEKENVLFPNLDLVLRARIDTGATTSSLDARDVQLFERNGEEWVRFNILNPQTGEFMELERRRVRRVLITQANVEEPERRPVIELRVTLGNITQVAEFTLSDRSHLEFPVLIGRNILRDVMLVDVSKVNFAPLVPPEKPTVNGRAAQ